MKTIVFFLIVFSVVLSCKENKQLGKPPAVEDTQEVSVEKKSTPYAIKSLAKFGITSYVDTMDINQILQFKAINENGIVESIGMERAEKLYNQMTKNKEVDSWPIFEINGSDEVILPVDGKGFGGAIWAKVLVDKSTLKIKKVEFNQKAESEGYGDAMTQSVFEDRFIGAKIDLDENTFGLKNNIEKRVDDGVLVDGIAGATMTSRGAVDMLNYGLRKYKGYLAPE